MLFTCTALFSDCEIVDDNKSQSYNLFEISQNLYSNNDYSNAYDTLLKSLLVYNPKPNSSKIELNYSCINYIPGPYAPIIQHSSKTEIFDFKRNNLGKLIKRQLSPAPYIFIQFQDDKTIISAVNSIKTSRNELKKRLSLENFIVSIDGEELNFGRLKVGELVSKSMKKNFQFVPIITTSEDFGFQLYK